MSSSAKNLFTFSSLAKTLDNWIIAAVFEEVVTTSAFQYLELRIIKVCE